LVNFNVIIDNLSSYTKKEIDKGKTPLDVYSICSAIKEAFCISFSIRKNNNFHLILLNELTVVRLNGEKLRFLGPDERSQSLLLLKALDLVRNLTKEESTHWLKSTPGIFVKKFNSIDSLLQNTIHISNRLFILIDKTEESITSSSMANLSDIKFQEKDEFILFFSEKMTSLKHIINILQERFKIFFIKVNCDLTLEEKILLINITIDQQTQGE